VKPEKYRGFLVELAAEDAGDPVFPLWDYMPEHEIHVKYVGGQNVKPKQG